MPKNFTLSILAILPLAISCGDRTPPRPKQENPTASIAEKLERANRLAADRDQILIETYLEQHELQGFERQADGIYAKTWGEALASPAVEGENVLVAYRLELLNGTIIRTLDSTTAEKLTLGKRNRTAGLDNLLLLTAPGQQAVGLIPSHLGYGLHGDGSKVPPHACLLYRVYWLRKVP